MTQAEVAALLKDCLTLWDVSGTLVADDDGLTIQAGAASCTIRRADPPMRWRVETARRRRAVPSVVALLGAVRGALGVEVAGRARAGDGATLAPHPPLAPSESLTPPSRATVEANESEPAIPIAIVTGFLGSGKTTLISRLLREPALANTAVIVNELGEIALDHELMERSDETLVTLANGCLCCAVRGDLVRTLLDLAHRRSTGAICFDRVLIETSGRADPAPILHALMADPALADHAIGAVVTLVDAQLGAGTLARFPEARRQVAFADRVVLTKTDVVPATHGLMEDLARLNATATVTAGLDDPTLLFTGSRRHDGIPNPVAEHAAEVEAQVVRRESAVPALALTLLAQALAEHCGSRLLRVKGIVAVAERPDRPALMHGVQHVFSALTWLPSWPSADRTTRIVVIGERLPRHFAARLLDAIIDDISAATTTRGLPV